MVSTTDSATFLLKDVTSDLLMNISDRIISQSNFDVQWQAALWVQLRAQCYTQR